LDTDSLATKRRVAQQRTQQCSFLCS